MQRNLKQVLGQAVLVGILAVSSWWLIERWVDLRAQQKLAAVEAVRPLPTPKGRATFTMTSEELVDNYNMTARKLDERLLLPPVPALRESARNDKFHVLSHQVADGAYVQMEIDNRTARPFSLSFLGGVDQKRKVESASELLAVMTSVGVAVLGSGEGAAGMLARMCAVAAKKVNSSHSERVGVFNVHCSNLDGALMGGVARFDE